MVEIKWIKIVIDVFTNEKIFVIESIQKAESLIVIW